MFVFDVLAKRAELTVAQSAQHVLAPAAQGHGNHPRHRRMPAGHFHEILFHHPVELQASVRAARIGDGGKGMDDISK